MMLTNDTLPECVNFDKCKNKGKIQVNNNWWCGKCFTKYLKKMEERQKNLMLE